MFCRVILFINLSVAMRAKENLEILKEKIFLYELVKKTIYDLLPLRTDKIKTKEYFERYLFADARYWNQSRKFNGSFSDSDFKERENEVPHTLVSYVRSGLLSVIFNDVTFIYAYNIIVQGVNLQSVPYKILFCDMKEENTNTTFIIENTCMRYKEDYPKSILGDFLLNTDNWEFYESNYSKYNKEDEWWLNAFNLAYEIFDKVRIKSYNPSTAQYLIKNIYFNDKELEEIVIAIIKNLFHNYSYRLTSDQKMKYAMICKKIEEYENKSFISIDSKYLHKMKEFKLDKINWLHATKRFNYNIMRLWVTSENFNIDQKNKIINIMESKYYQEKECIPDILIYDLSTLFIQLRKEINSNWIADNNEIADHGEISFKKEDKDYQSIINEQKKEIEKLKDIIENSINEVPVKGMTMSKVVLVIYYLFNELGLNFNNSDKTSWAGFINKLTGFNYQNIRYELTYLFKKKNTQKNLKELADLFKDLFPNISNKINNDSEY